VSTLFDLRYMDDFVIMAPTRHRLRRAIKEVHAVMGGQAAYAALSGSRAGGQSGRAVCGFAGVCGVWGRWGV
jgi:hypothetical protein